MNEQLTKWHWEQQPEAANLLAKWLADATGKNAWLKTFGERLYATSGNRLGDLVEMWIVPDNDANRSELARVGYVEQDVPAEGPMFHHPGGMFPRVMLAPHTETDLGIKIEHCADFATANGLTAPIHGKPGQLVRYVKANSENGINVYGIERRGTLVADCEKLNSPSLADQAEVLEAFRTRTRVFEDEVAGFEQMATLIDNAIDQVGQDVACALWFAAERDYWQRRNRAARYQYARQDALGVGWANHDHHTYRSSRRHFHRLVGLWEKLGFYCRERFYPGPEAGWGAQVMEQPVCGIVTFNDVDISPSELLTDFAHEPMQEDESLATVGLWCALHGESVLQAGMHHLECTFDFVALRDQMASDGIKTMRAFSDFEYLKQAFTEGERWPVAENRIATLLKDGKITDEQAAEFRKNGAIGSHLENLERNNGFKGFNQTGVTQIIKETDPRQQKLAGV